MRRAHAHRGIVDDVSASSLAWHPIPSGDLEPASQVRALFGLGADGTVGANKNSIKIIGELEGFHAQGYFVYDSRSRARAPSPTCALAPEPIERPWLIEQASFIGCHPVGLCRIGGSAGACRRRGDPAAQCSYEPDRVWAELPSGCALASAPSISASTASTAIGWPSATAWAIASHHHADLFLRAGWHLAAG